MDGILPVKISRLHPYSRKSSFVPLKRSGVEEAKKNRDYPQKVEVEISGYI